MRMFIPEIGTRLVLEEDWTFDVHEEHRNKAIFDPLSAVDPSVRPRLKAEMDILIRELREARQLPDETANAYSDRRSALWMAAHNHIKLPITLPRGTELAVDRIYIRKGISEYSSISFNLTRTTHPLLQGRGRKRFWAKLADVNKIRFTLPA